MNADMKGKKFAIYHHWLGSAGNEHRRKVYVGSFNQVVEWFRRKTRDGGFKFVKDSSLFGGYYIDVTGAWYNVDIYIGHTRPGVGRKELTKKK